MSATPTARASHYRLGGESLSQNDVRVSLIELERLLVAMERQYQQGLEESWHSLQFMLDRCFALWNNVDAAMQTEALYPLVPSLSDDRLKSIQSKVLDLSSKFTAAIEARKDGDTSDALIHQIFRPRSFHKAVSDDREGQDLDDESKQSESSKANSENLNLEKGGTSSSGHQVQPPRAFAAAPTVEDLQRIQREQVELAISQMASQLKDETARINETLRGQTDGLDDLEDVAADNVQQVSDVAKDVERHVQSSWNRNIGTWTLFFTIVGAFFFVLVIIQMAPKGKGCVFFCQEQPGPDEFCRILPNGRRECIRSDDGDGSENVDPSRQEEREATLYTEESYTTETDRELSPSVDDEQEEPEECILNELGECVEEREDVDAVKSFGGVELTKKEQQELLEDAADNPFFGSETSEELVDGNRPLHNRKHFSPIDVRNAANLGEYDLLVTYLTIKPEWADKTDANGWSALHLCTRRGDIAAIQFLRQIGADFTLKTRDGRTAGDIALAIHGEDHPLVQAVGP